MHKDFLNQIKECRINQELSLKELSEKADISYNYLLMLENGKKKNPTLNTLIKIAKALNVEITFIYKN